MTTLTEVKLKNVQYVLFYVKDTEKSLPFYRDTLGLTVKEAHPGWVELDGGSVTVALHGHESLPADHQETTNVCFTVDNIQGTYETLKARGVQFRSEPKEVCGDEKHVGLCAEFFDQDGNSLSIFEYRAR